MENISCCTVECEMPLDQEFWNQKYASNDTGWDLGCVSPAIKMYIDKIVDKNVQILIPGCGNAYEAQYLLDNGFTNITVIDIAPLLVQDLKEKLGDNPNINIVLGDFFALDGQFDLIVEQTFFCALPPFMRQRYVAKMHQLLKPSGTIAGLLFNRHFDQGPPFGGDEAEYRDLFRDAFDLKTLSITAFSVGPRAGSELFFDGMKNQDITVELFKIEGMTCSSCATKLYDVLYNMDTVLSASISTDFGVLMIKSTKKLDWETLQNTLSYDKNHTFTPIHF